MGFFLISFKIFTKKKYYADKQIFCQYMTQQYVRNCLFQIRFSTIMLFDLCVKNS